MRRLALAALTALAAQTLPAGAGPAPQGLDLLPAPSRAQVERAGALAGSLRAAAPMGIAPTLRALLAVRGAILPAVELPAPGPADLDAVAGLPAGLRAPVAGLLAAVRAADAMVGDVPIGEVRASLRRSLDALDRWGRAGGPIRRIAPRPGTRGRPRVLPQAPPTLSTTPAIRAAAAHSTEAASLLAAAIDRHLPAIRAWRGRAPGDGAGCDVLDQAPLLCIGGEGAGTYVDEAALTIDLGGDDTYRTSAASAPFVADGTSFGVSVLIDRAGDDRYDPAPNTSPLLPGVLVAQGTGVMGGTGILVDVAGQDRYLAAAPPTQPGTGASVLAQGAGLGGHGLLVDLGGDDVRAATGHDGTDDGIGIIAHGAAFSCAGDPNAPPPNHGCAVAAVVDLGVGSDAYVADAGTAHGLGSRQVRAQGVGSFGVGAVIDDGGTDSFLIAAGARQPGNRSYFEEASPGAFVEGQGYGITGLGAVVEGDGNTEYTMDVESEGTAWNTLHGQASSLVQGTAILDDLDGDDRYSIRSSMDSDLQIVVDDTCTVLDEELGEEVPCTRAEAAVDLYRSTLSNGLGGQGASAFQSVAVLRDRGGDDDYLAAGEQTLTVTLEDRLSAPEEPPILTVGAYDQPGIDAQGSGTGFTATAALVDDAGRDDYLLRSFNDTRASAISQHGGEPEVRAVSTGRYFLSGQGAGDFGGLSAALVDLGGSRDRFEVVAHNPVSTSPEGGGFQYGPYWPYFQGAFGGVFVAMGDDPVIVSRPSRPVCATSPGRRGFGAWNDCVAPESDPEHSSYDAIPIWTHHTLGLAPRAEGREVSLVTTAPTVAELGARIPVSARLLGPDGKPLAGVPVHFDLQYGCTLLCAAADTSATGGRFWSNQWWVETVTDADGVARATLPVTLQAWQTDYDKDPWVWRVMATFDGAEGLYPKHVPASIDVQR